MLKIPILLVVMLASQLAFAQSPAAKQVAGVRSKDTPSGTVVTITSDELLSRYGAYREGDTYRVLIPDVSLALNNVHVEGTSFSNAKVEATGTNLIFSFQLKNGVNPSVSQKANQLEINFARLEVASTGAISTTAIVLPRREPEVSTPINEPEAASASGNSTAAANPAAATPAPQAIGDGTISSINADLAVPDSPAFTVLGVTPENVTHPTTPREFATSLLNGVDERGNFQTGLALDFVPFLTFFGKDTSLKKYADQPLTRFLARTQVSFATAKGVTDEDRSTRLALGLRMTIWDKGDPRSDKALEECYDTADDDPKFRTEAFVPFDDDSEDEKAQKLAEARGIVGRVNPTL